MKPKTWEEIKKIPHGTKVRANVDNQGITEGVISVDKDGRIFVCTNNANGNVAQNRFGYKFSWEITVDYVHEVLFEDLITEDYPIF